MWSDEATRAHGTITARGGAQGGDGGLVETSGKYLEAAGIRVDASAPNGAAGRMAARSGRPARHQRHRVSPAVNASGGPPPNAFESATTATVPSQATVGARDIKTALENSTNVTLSTGLGIPGSPGFNDDGNIYIDANITKDAGGGSTLTLKAHNAILVTPRSSIASTSGALNLILNADSDGNSQGAVHIGGTVPCFVSPCAAGSSPSISTNGGRILISGGPIPRLAERWLPVIPSFSERMAWRFRFGSSLSGSGKCVAQHRRRKRRDPGGRPGRHCRVERREHRRVDDQCGSREASALTASVRQATRRRLQGGRGVELNSSSLTASGHINITGVGGAGATGYSGALGGRWRCRRRVRIVRRDTTAWETMNIDRSRRRGGSRRIWRHRRPRRATGVELLSWSLQTLIGKHEHQRRRRRRGASPPLAARRRWR